MTLQRFAAVACVIATTFPIQHANAQEEVVVMDLRLFNANQRLITMDGTPNGKPFDLLGISVGRPGSVIRDHVASPGSVFKKEGYTWQFQEQKLACRGRIITGVSTPYVARMVAGKTTNDAKDSIHAIFASPLFSNEAIAIERKVAYTTPEAAPSHTAFLEQLVRKYGSPKGRSDGSGNFPIELRWPVHGAQLVVRISYFDGRPGIVQSADFYMNLMRGRTFVRYDHEEQQKICAATKHVDDKRIEQMNAANTKAPRL